MKLLGKGKTSFRQEKRKSRRLTRRLKLPRYRLTFFFFFFFPSFCGRLHPATLYSEKWRIESVEIIRVRFTEETWQMIPDGELQRLILRAGLPIPVKSATQHRFTLCLSPLLSRDRFLLFRFVWEHDIAEKGREITRKWSEIGTIFVTSLKKIISVITTMTIF